MSESKLAIFSAPFISGAELSFIESITELDRKDWIIILPIGIEKESANLFNKFNKIFLPLIWYKKTYNPIYYIIAVINLLYISFKIHHIIKKNKTTVLFNNSFKSYIYSVPIKLMIPKINNICFIRDNITKRKINKLILSFADEIICVSKYILESVPSQKGKIKLIYTGLDTKEWHYEKIKTKGYKFNQKERKIILAQISQITKWKNQIHSILALINIINQGEFVHLLIIGNPYSKADKKYKRKLIEIITKNKLNNYVSFIDFTNDIKSIYKEVDIIIHPAINEPFGRVALEAMSMEKPIVAYNCGGITEIIVDGETGFLAEPKNYQQLAEKVSELIENKELRIRMGKAGRQRVIEKFNIEKYVRDMQEVFGSI